MLARTLMVLTAAWPLAACGGGGTEFDGPLTYVRGGGATGEARTLILRPDGTGSAEVSRGTAAPVRVAVRLTPAERGRLRELVPEIDLDGLEQDDSEPIPDAFSYSIALGGDEADWQAAYIPPELSALWAELEGLAEKYEPA